MSGGTKKAKVQPPRIYRVLILPDIHVPFHDEKSLKTVEKFMAKYRWDEYIQLGDLLDFDMISKFNQDMLRKLEARRILKDYEIANDLLDRHQAIVRKKNPQAKFTLLEGNHEFRIEVLLDKAPQFEGLLEVDKNLRLADRGFKWVRSWSQSQLHKVGKLYFHHGEYTNKYHPSKMIDNFGVNLCYGHTHDSSTYESIKRGDGHPIKAYAMGHLAETKKLTYTRNKPNNWTQMIGIAEVWPNGNFCLYQIPIINHQLIWNGKVYSP